MGVGGWNKNVLGGKKIEKLISRGGRLLGSQEYLTSLLFLYHYICSAVYFTNHSLVQCISYKK